VRGPSRLLGLAGRARASHLPALDLRCHRGDSKTSKPAKREAIADGGFTALQTTTFRSAAPMRVTQAIETLGSVARGLDSPFM